MCGHEPILGVTSDLFLCLSLRQWFRRFQHRFLLFRMRLRCFQKKDGKCSSTDMVSESHRHFFIFGCFACSFSSLIAPASIGQVYHVSITFAAVYARLRFFFQLVFPYIAHNTLCASKPHRICHGDICHAESLQKASGNFQYS